MNDHGKSVNGRPASWSSGQSLWLLIMKSRVRFPALGVPTSEVGYTPAMPRREDHEVHKGHVVALGGEFVNGQLPGEKTN